MMSKKSPRTRRFLTIAFFLAIPLLWALRLAGTGKELAHILQSVRSYEGLIRRTPAVSSAALEALEDRLAALDAVEEPLAAPGGTADTPEENPSAADKQGQIIDTLALLRKLLKEASIQPERFRITGTVPNERAECILRCPADRFFAFLGELSRHEELRLTYLTIKNGSESGPITITMRVKYEL